MKARKAADTEHGQAIVEMGVNGEARSIRGLRARLAMVRQRGVRLFNAEDGGPIVEFTLVLPLLMILMTGIFTFGIALNTYMQLTEATGVGARILSISRGQTTDPCATTSSAVYAAAPMLTEANYTFSFVLNGVSYSGASCSSSSTTTGAAGNLVQGENAKVTVTYPCNLSIYGYNYAPSCKLQSETTELVQ